MDAPQIAVVGPGAMGLLWGLKLLKAGCGVTFVDHRAARARKLMEEGVTLELDGRSEKFEIRVVLPDFPIERVDLLFVSVKSHSTASAIEPLRPAIGLDTAVVSLQNGLEHIEPLREAAGLQRLVLGVTSMGANCPKAGTVVHAGNGPTLVGALADAGAKTAERAAEILARTGFDVKTAGRIMARIWEKLAINAAINPLTAIHDVSNRRIAEDDALRERAIALMRECVKVAEVEGYELDYAEMEKRLLEVARRTGDNISSMLQDVRAGRRTEIEAINGAVLRIARRRHVKCPQNEKALAEVIERAAPKSMEEIRR